MLTTEQHLHRARGIGSSEMASAANENPFANAHDLWLRKRGLTDHHPDTLSTWLGHQLEPVLAARYELETGIALERDQNTYTHPTIELCPDGAGTEFGVGRMVSTPDYRHHGDRRRLVECKTVGGRMVDHWSAQEAEGAPPYVFIQCQHQMMVTGATHCDVAVLLLGFEVQFRIYQFEWDPAFCEALVSIGRNFWKHVVEGEHLPIDASDSARAVLMEVYKNRRPVLKEAPLDAIDWMDRRIAASEAEKAAKIEKALASNKLIEIIGDAEGLIGEGFKATFLADKNAQRTLRVTEIGKKRKAAA